MLPGMLHSPHPGLYILAAVVTAAVAIDARAERVSFRTTDGLTIAADWTEPVGAKRGVILALHMYQSDRSAWAPLVAPAQAQGLGVLAIDLRGHGESARQGDADLAERATARDATLFNAMHRDVDAAMGFLKGKGFGPEKIVLIGASVGCSVALHWAAEHPRAPIAGAILLTPGKSYLGVPSITHIAAWGQRSLLIATSNEEAFKGAQALYEASPDRARTVLWKLPQTGIHGTKMFGKVPRVAERLVEWAAIRLGLSVR